MAKKNKKHELNGIQKVLAGIRQDRYMLDQRERDTQYECTHKRGNSLRLKQTKTEGVFRCKECGAKLDFRFLMKNSDPETIKAELKEAFGYEVSEDEIFTTTPIISTHTGEKCSRYLSRVSIIGGKDYDKFR